MGSEGGEARSDHAAQVGVSVGLDLKFSGFATEGGASGMSDAMSEEAGRQENDLAGVVDREAEVVVVCGRGGVDHVALASPAV